MIKDTWYIRVPTASYKSYNLLLCPIFLLYFGKDGICPIYPQWYHSTKKLLEYHQEEVSIFCVLIYHTSLNRKTFYDMVTFHDMMIFGDISWYNYDDIWWHFMTYDDIWWHFMTKHVVYHALRKKREPKWLSWRVTLKIGSLYGQPDGSPRRAILALFFFSVWYIMTCHDKPWND